MKYIIAVLVFLYSSIFTNSLYFYLNKNEEKCFHDEFYTDVVVMIKYEIINKNIKLEKQSEKRVKIQITNTSEKVISTYESGKLSGKFSLNIEESGNYKICVHSNDEDFFNKRNIIKFSLTIDTDGDDPYVESSTAKTDDFKKIDNEVKTLLKKSAEIMNMQEFQMNREEEFSENQFQMSKRIVFLTIIQVVIISFVGIWQICALRSVFKEKAWSLF